MPYDWINVRIPEPYREGQAVSGRIVELAPFGAFVELEPGVFALLMVTEIEGPVRHPGDVLSVGDQIEARLLFVNREHRKVTLTTDQAAAVIETRVSQSGERPARD